MATDAATVTTRARAAAAAAPVAPVEAAPPAPVAPAVEVPVPAPTPAPVAAPDVAQPQQPHRPRLDIRMEPFSGPDDWHLWREKFDMYRQYARLSDRDALTELLLLLSGQAQRVAFSVPAARRTLQVIIERLNTTFIPSDDVLRDRIRQRRQRPDEPVLTYSADLTALLSQLDPVMTEQERAQYLRDGLRPELQRIVALHGDIGYDQLVHRAESAELSERLQARQQHAETPA